MPAPAPLGRPRICCLDLDTFFVSVERLFDPSLEGQPVIVGALPGQRGVVTAASYEVRRFGVRSGMSIRDAVRLAPDAIYLPTRHGVYGGYSEQVRRLAEHYCPEVRAASIDEFYLDFDGCERLYRQPKDANDDAAIERTIVELTREIKLRLGLPASVGVGTSKPIAKIASGMAKPAGVLMVPAGTERAFLAPLPVRKLPGIGAVAEQRLKSHGIETLGQLATLPLDTLHQLFGSYAASLKQRALGGGANKLGRDRPAFREHDPDGQTLGSISNECTFMADLSDEARIQRVLCRLSERVCWRARRRGVKARTVTLKLRYADFQTLTRGKTISPTHAERQVYEVVRQLYRGQISRRRARIRLLGVQLSNLQVCASQLELFDQDRPLCRAVDQIRERYGFDAIHLSVGERPSRSARQLRRFR